MMFKFVNFILQQKIQIAPSHELLHSSSWVFQWIALQVLCYPSQDRLEPARQKLAAPKTKTRAKQRPVCLSGTIHFGDKMFVY